MSSADYDKLEEKVKMNNNTSLETWTSYAPNRVNRLWMALVLGALSALAPLSIDMYLPSLPELAKNLHATASQAQLSLTACLLGLAFGQVIAGPISDARGRRAPLVIGMAIYTVTSLSCALTSSIWLLIVLRLLQGLSGSAGIVIARAIVRDYFSGSEMTRFFARLMLVNGAAPILAPIIGAQLLRFMSWHGVFIVLAVLGVLMLVGVLIGVPESLPVEQRATGGLAATLSTMRNLLSDRVFMGFVLSQGLVFAAMFAYIAGSPFVLQNIFGVSPQVFSLIFAMNGLGIIISGQIGGHLSARAGERPLLVAGLITASVGSLLLFAAILFLPTLSSVLPPLFLVVSSVGIVSATSTSLALQNQSKSAGSASALIGLSGMLAGSLVTPLVGVAGGNADLPMALVILVCDLSAIAFYFLLARRQVAG